MTGGRLQSRAPALLLAALLSLAAAAALAASWRDVAQLFRAARYDEARRALPAPAAGERAGAEALWWGTRLETDPAAALAALRAGAARDDLPRALRARFAREVAGIEFARRRWGPCLEALDDARRLAGAPPVGDAQFWADAAAAALAGGRARAASPVPTPAAATGGDAAAPNAAAAAPGRWYVQLGAFTDRQRATALLRRWSDELPELRLVAEADAGGSTLYKVRLGAWDRRGEAATAAERLRRELGIESIVVEGPARP